MYTGGSGKVFTGLYFLRRRLKISLRRGNQYLVTPNTITDPEIFITEYSRNSKKSYVVADGERILGAATIGTPIFDNLNKVVPYLTNYF